MVIGATTISRPVLYYGEEKTCTYSTECPGYDFASCSTGYLSQPCTACGTTKYKCTQPCVSTGCSGYTLTEQQACDTCTYGSKPCTDSCGTMKFKCCSSSEAYQCFKCTIDDDIMAHIGCKYFSRFFLDGDKRYVSLAEEVSSR